MLRQITTGCFALLILVASQSAYGGQAFVEHLEPPTLERGKTTRVTVVGANLANALDVWTSLPGVKVRATPVGESKPGVAVFDVQVSQDAPVGLFGLRVATADGLGNLHLCLIDDLPCRRAPDTAKGPVRVDLPCALWGRFRAGEVDRFTFNVKAGQRVNFETVGNRFGKEIDPILIVRDAKESIVVERDNDPGLHFDCRVEHTFADGGTYTVEIRDVRHHGHEHGYYVLRMGRFPAARVAVPAVVAPGKRAALLLPELNETLKADVPASTFTGLTAVTLRRADDEGSTWLPVEVSEADVTVANADALTPEKGTLAKVPGQLCGVLVKPGKRQFFRMELAKGQVIQVSGHGRWQNSPIDLDLILTDATGKTIRQATEAPDETVQLDFTAPAAAVYCLGVRDLARDAGPAYAYRLEVRDNSPRVKVVAEVEGLTVPRESYQEIPFTVTRNGYNGAIALSLVGAPEGTTLTPVEIPTGATTTVCKLSAGAKTPLGLHSFQIHAQPTEGMNAPKSLVRTNPMVDRQRLNEDLIPYSLREDQRRLPPAVHDRFALQVTPPAPFTVGLDSPLVTLPRYQRADIPLVTTRKGDFAAPITFAARGGQLADKEEGRTRVYAEFPAATMKTLKVAGSIHSRILTNLGKSRIEVLASAVHEGRTITLIRYFELETRTAFTLTSATMPTPLAAGTSAKVRVAVDRVKTFSGPVRVKLAQVTGLEVPASITIPSDQTSFEIEVKAAATATPGRRSITLSASADVDGFEEEYNNARIEVEIPKPEAPKK